MCLAACSDNSDVMKDGYYTARTDGFYFGWQEHVTICVKDNIILTAEYDAITQSGFVKSWDMQYMRNTKELTGTYPSDYSRKYTDELIANQIPASTDVVTGATESHISFQILAQAAIEQAKLGDHSVKVIDVWG